DLDSAVAVMSRAHGDPESAGPRAPASSAVSRRMGTVGAVSGVLLATVAAILIAGFQITRSSLPVTIPAAPPVAASAEEARPPAPAPLSAGAHPSPPATAIPR